MEVNFLRSDGTGRLATCTASTTSNVVAVDDAIPFRSGQVVVLITNSTGLIVGGPVTVLSRDVSWHNYR